MMEATKIENQYFYPRSPCGERPCHPRSVSRRHAISIHALLAESDKQQHHCFFGVVLFLSTLSLRRATNRCVTIYTRHRTFLSTLSLRRATGPKLRQFLRALISIHALLAESDPSAAHASKASTLFLSTLSLRRATPRGGYCYLDNLISIHALLAESDNRYGRPIDVQLVFLSTLSLRRATYVIRHAVNLHPISIHALLAESDVSFMLYDTTALIFLSTLSLRRATLIGPLIFKVQPHFYPRSPCGERRQQPAGEKQRT